MISKLQDPDRLVCIGMITAPHGVRGAVRVKSFTADPEAITRYGPLYNAPGSRKFTFSQAGWVRQQVIVKIDGVQDRDQAEGLRGTKLYVPRDALPDLNADDEYYLTDLVGLTVEWADGSYQGVVKGVADFGAGDVVEVVLEDGKILVLPFTKDAVPVVDLANRRLVVDPPEGLDVSEDASKAKGRRAEAAIREGAS